MSYNQGTARGLVTSNFADRADLQGYYNALRDLDTSQTTDEKSPGQFFETDNDTASFQSSYLASGHTLDRWPTLFEILNKKTSSPVDLWSFYVYMRDQQKSIDYLDFWIDTVQHMNLCKVYVRGLKESLLVNERLHDADREADRQTYESGSRGQQHQRSSSGADSPKRNSVGSDRSQESKSSSILLDLLMKQDMFQGNDSHRLSEFLRGEAAVRTSDPVVNAKIDELRRRSQSQRQLQAAQRALQEGSWAGGAPSTEVYQPKAKEAGRAYERESRIDPEMVEAFIQEDALNNNRSVSEGHFVTRATLRKSSHNILNAYFLDGSEKRVLIPDDMRQRVIYAIESEGRDDPEVFDESREYVFKAMEHEAYPNFLRDSAMCNVTSRSSVMRMFLAVAAAFAGFWTGYTLIFLDYHPRGLRALVTIPFFIASYLFFSSFYRVDPLLCFLGLAESRASSHGYIPIREPFVRQLLVKRSLFVLFLICIVAAAFSVLFALVPGMRLHH